MSGRCFPDITAAGVNLPVYLSGSIEPASGTSCAAPVTAGIFSLLNDMRLAQNKPPLGFLNPLLYKNPQAFRDIDEGYIVAPPCPRIQAIPGFDPATGLGSPLFSHLAEVVKNLP